MSRLIPGWTRAHLYALALLAPPLLGTAVSAWGDPPRPGPAIPALFALTAAVAVGVDPLVSFAPGLAGAAAMIFLKQSSGLWGPETFAPSSLETLAFVTTGLAAGFAGSGLRRMHRPEAAPATPTSQPAAFGPLGLLPAELGELRLEEEVDRARMYRRPLALMRISLEPLESPRPSGAEREAVGRAVARCVQSALRITDVPFACGDDCIVAILPETDRLDARRLASRLAAALRAATFHVRPEGGRAVRRPVMDHAIVRVGLAAFPEDGATAGELLEASARALAELPLTPTSADRVDRPDRVRDLTTAGWNEHPDG